MSAVRLSDQPGYRLVTALLKLVPLFMFLTGVMMYAELGDNGPGVSFMMLLGAWPAGYVVMRITGSVYGGTIVVGAVFASFAILVGMIVFAEAAVSVGVSNSDCTPGRCLDFDRATGEFEWCPESGPPVIWQERGDTAFSGTVWYVKLCGAP